MENQSRPHDGGPGILYVVSTPIGNLEDITIRALRVLKEVDLIAAENVIHSKGMCRHHGIDTRLISYNQHNRMAKGPEIIRKLKAGSDIALITCAGTPAVSDPGSYLISLAVKEGIRACPIPGPSAVITALSVSGIRMDRFLFLGFLSNKAGKRRKELKGVKDEPRTIVFYEAPHRIQSMLTDIKDILGDRNMVLARELTKLYEDIMRGKVSDILKELDLKGAKGEITIVVEGKEQEETEEGLDEVMVERIEDALKKGTFSVRDIAEDIAAEKGLVYRMVYKECLRIKKALGE
jgi:16S rRNA (cytidine1402-2'-O)-methyltransferase